ncbi:TonB family protein [Myxococcota bacterium]|nr:TonB family protein [Myxococcota bacterium]MBU1898933.1 TonB family protein [Myxococcota bacterium]
MRRPISTAPHISKRRHARYLAAALLSLGVHTLALLPVARWALKPLEPRPNAEAEALSLLSEEDVARLLKKRHPLLKKREEEEEAEARELKGQIVEIAPPDVEEKPKDARLLSEYDSAVKREQVSVHRRPPKKKRAAQTAQRQPTPKPLLPQKKPNQDKRGDQKDPQARPEVKPRATMAEPGQGPLSPQRAPKAGGQAGGPEHYQALLPQTSSREIAEQSGSLDHIDDTPKGNETFLNTRAYKYAWFFNRVKREVAHRWDALGAHRRYDPYGRVFGVRDRLTVVQVVLDPAGGLEEIFILERSGAAHLDESAIQAFKDAQPFPNPPLGLRGEDGRVRFKFGFYLEIDGRGGMRWLR